MRRSLLLLMFFVVFLVGCQKDNDIKSIDTPSNAENLIEISYENFDFSSGCVDAMGKNEFVVNTQEDYEGILFLKEKYIGCNDYSLPSIDFSKKTLIGKRLEGVSGCKYEIQQRVMKDERNKRIIYSLDILERGACEPARMIMNAVLIPKISSEYKVEFDVKTQKE